jgi:deazaflavin-dependent oxidoreductase (nitroreductase family)
MSDYNETIIKEFRTHEGRVGGSFEGAPLLLLHTTGARSGTERVNPMMYRRLSEDQVAVFASKGGYPTNPDWYHNLVAHPDATVEIGTETYPVHARLTSGAEREEIWSAHKAQWPGFAEYETATTREIPVVVLERLAAAS